MISNGASQELESIYNSFRQTLALQKLAKHPDAARWVLNDIQAECSTICNTIESFDFPAEVGQSAYGVVTELRKLLSGLLHLSDCQELVNMSLHLSKTVIAAILSAVNLPGASVDSLQMLGRDIERLVILLQTPINTTHKTVYNQTEAIQQKINTYIFAEHGELASTVSATDSPDKAGEMPPVFLKDSSSEVRKTNFDMTIQSPVSSNTASPASPSHLELSPLGPPPPPPPGNFNLTTSYYAKAKNNMVHLDWKKLGNVKSTSIWGKIRDDPNTNTKLNERELISLYEVAQKKQHASAAEPFPGGQPKPQPINKYPISNRKLQNAEIFLKGLRMNSKDVITALLSVDESNLPLEKLEQISKIIPTTSTKD